MADTPDKGAGTPKPAEPAKSGSADKTAQAKPAPAADKAPKDAKGKAKNKRERKAKTAGRRSGSKGKGSHSTRVLVVSIVIALVVGVCGGMLAYRILPLPGSQVALAGATTVSENQLDTVLGTYTYNGQTHNITVRDAIEENSSLDAAKNDDGTYNVPSADTVLATARYQILDLESQSRGIQVSDDDMSEYAKNTFGSDDYATIASTYSMDEDQVKQIMRESTSMKKLHDQVVQGDEPTAPTAPTAPADGQEDTPTADYAQYIINLVGDEWDSDNNTWARTDGDYYAALSSYTISNDSATYDAAQAAYTVAQQKYSKAETDYNNQWTSFVNGLLSNASISLGTLVTG